MNVGEDCVSAAAAWARRAFLMQCPQSYNSAITCSVCGRASIHDLEHLGHILFWEDPQSLAAMINRFLDGRL
jgi:hypothetical protein